MQPAPEARQAQDGDHADIRPFGGLRLALAAGLIVFLTALIGLIFQSLDGVFAFWPANAVFLGLLIRVPGMATPAGFLSAAAAYFLAGVSIDNPVPASIAFSAINLASVATACLLYKRHAEDIRRLRRVAAIPVLLLNSLIAASVAAVSSALLAPSSAYDSSMPAGWPRLVIEFVNHLAILPLILSAPQISWRWLDRRRYGALDLDWRRSLPVLFLLLCGAMSLLIRGPFALLIPLPALLWCALRYSVFGTALLCLGCSTWTLLLISTGIVHLPARGGLMEHALSARLVVGLIGFAPVIVAVSAAARKELLRQLLDIASRDALTGLLNRHTFRDRCNLVLNQLRLDQKAASLLIINIDHFRLINEERGHMVGDQVLGGFSTTVSACLRATDLFGRLGADEFAVLLVDCAGDNARMVAERIRSTVAATPIGMGNQLQLQITVSIGIAPATITQSDIEALLLAADSALYRAKKSGRNRIESELSRIS